MKPPNYTLNLTDKNKDIWAVRDIKTGESDQKLGQNLMKDTLTKGKDWFIVPQ